NLQLWVKAGSIFEEEYTGSGISHYVEHMLFKGTKKRRPGEIAGAIRSLGGEINAYTSYEKTVYHISLPSKHYGEALEILADAAMNSSFDKKELEKEQEVILKEINMGEDDPSRKISRLLWQEAFRVHPYKYPVIGDEQLFLRLKRDDLLKYYRRMYRPDNMILVMVGDFKREEALGKAEEVFANFRQEPAKPIYVPSEPSQTGEREITKEKEVNITHLRMAFHIPDITSVDLFGLDTLAILLGQGRSSRLYQEIKEKKGLVHSISAYSYTPLYPGLFVVSATLDFENLEKAKEAILEELERLKKEDVQEEDLSKARENVLSDYLFSKETAEGEAGDLASSRMYFGHLKGAEFYIDGIKKVKPEDVVRVAKRYFTEENMTIAILQPKGKGEIEREKGKEEKELKTEKVVLENGLTLLICENPGLPIVSLRAVFSGGVRTEDEDNNGICNLASQMLIKGTLKSAQEEISRSIEEKGGSISVYSGNNSFGVSLDLLSKDIGLGLEVLADCLINSIFPEEELEKERKVVLASVKSLEDNFFSLMQKAIGEAVFKVHPYRLQTIGTKESVTRLTRDDLLNFKERFCQPAQMVLAIFGDVKKEEVVKKVEEAFKDLKYEELPPINPPKEPQISKVRREIKEKEGEQSALLIGFLRPTLFEKKDVDVLEVMGAILGGQDGRLFTEIREKRGLAYYTGIFGILGPDPGLIVFYAGTTREKLREVEKLLLKEIKRIKTRHVRDEELELAKNNLIGQAEVASQKNSQNAFRQALDELYGLGFDNSKDHEERIRAVTKEDIKQVANKYFKKDNYAVAIIQSK
ncbi:insulinase family protein, partial [bacterium]|nr:insulinase family protein [bacterium]MBU1614183.1 insulinase family protein [bacterium]